MLPKSEWVQSQEFTRPAKYDMRHQPRSGACINTVNRIRRSDDGWTETTSEPRSKYIPDCVPITGLGRSITESLRIAVLNVPSVGKAARPKKYAERLDVTAVVTQFM